MLAELSTGLDRYASSKSEFFSGRMNVVIQKLQCSRMHRIKRTIDYCVCAMYLAVFDRGLGLHNDHNVAVTKSIFQSPDCRVIHACNFVNWRRAGQS